MRITPFFNRLISVLAVMLVLLTVGTLTVFAEPEDGSSAASEISGEAGDAQGAQGDQNDPGVISADDPDITSQPDQGGESQLEPDDGFDDNSGQEPHRDEPTEPYYDDYISAPADTPSSYIEPEDLSDLPKVEPGEVQPATSVSVPESVVSDASVFSGIVMWLCVALGIAVVVGVLVSKRTRRRG